MLHSVIIYLAQLASYIMDDCVNITEIIERHMHTLSSSVLVLCQKLMLMTT